MRRMKKKRNTARDIHPKRKGKEDRKKRRSREEKRRRKR